MEPHNKIHKRRRAGLSSAAPYAYIAPSVLIILVILGIPLLNLIWYSFAKVSIVGQLQKWVGLSNYGYLFSKQFAQTLGRTGIWVVFGMAGMFVIGMILSLCLNKPMPGRGFLRAAVIVPWVIPHVFSATMWMWVFDSQNGLLNNILKALGLIDQSIGFFSVGTAMATVIWIRIWKGTPFIIMSMLSAMQAIPSELEEAAQLDGATGAKYFWKVMLPLLKPVLLMSGIILLAWSITTFDIIYVTTAGGPLGATEIISISIFNEAFVKHNLGRSSAIAIFTMIVVSFAGYFLMRKNMKGAD